MAQSLHWGSAGKNGQGRAGTLSKLRITCLNNFSRLQVIRLWLVSSCPIPGAGVM